MEEFKEAAKRAGKIVLRTVTTLVFPVIAVICIILVLVSAFVYFITVDDGTYKEGDWSSTPYAASTYINGATINSDGTISFSMTPQELWDKMLENGSSVDDYLDTPEELAKLMKAEMVTQYPDTRPNPDEEVDWESVINGDSIQGIIKFKRADTEGNKSTMTYVDPATFQSYIDEYNSTGSEEAKQAALSHFTLKRSSVSSANGGINYNGPDLCWPVEPQFTTITSVFGYRGDIGVPGATADHGAIDIGDHGIDGTNIYACEEGTVIGISNDGSYNEGAGNFVSIDHGNGYVSRYFHMQTGSVVVQNGDHVDKGQVLGKVGSTGASSGPHCHFQIEYNGEKIDPLQFKYNNGQGNGTGGFGNSDSEDTDNEEEDEEKEETDRQEATETATNGDGYETEYTSSAGITYKQYKQIKGTYKDNPYWGGTIQTHGCGPTSLAILASGLTNLNYTPADVAREMNEKFGGTSPEYLKQQMESMGMTAEFTYSASAEEIQNNLRNGKVMLVCVNPGKFTSVGHLMAVLDINEQGQVYLSNPSSDSLNGWFDVSDIAGANCSYIVTTDAGATGIAKSDNTSNYVAVVATWKQVDTTVETDDPNVEGGKRPTIYTMTTTDINYEVMVEPYTMPFDLLWAFLVCGDGKGFVMDLADLVYDSDIEITVHDNLTVNTDIDHWTYTQRTKAEVGDATIVANCGGYTASGSVAAHTHDPWGEDQNYTTTKTVITQTNTLSIALTRANVWIVDYTNEFTYNESDEPEKRGEIKVDDTEYEQSGIGSTFDCTHIQSKKNELASIVRQKYLSAQNTTNESDGSSGAPGVTFDINVSVMYFTKYINILDTTTDKIETTKYIEGTPSLKEKTDPDSEEPNFVTIFNDSDYEKNSSSIRSVADWLFEILETNDSTSDMVDLIKYLLYKATGADYGVTEFDFSIFYPGSLTSVGANDYIVHIDKSSEEIVIDDVETLKTAFAGSGGAGSENLVAYAEDFLRLQEEYRVNAVFAAAVTTAECGAGTNLQIGGNNWFSIRNPNGGWMQYDSPAESIEAFCNQIARLGYYFTEGNYTVRSIGMIYCEDADAPGGWIENVLMYMTNMFNAAGIDVSQFVGGGGDFLEVAKQCHDYLVQNNYYYSSAANKSAGRYVYDAKSTGSSIPKPYPGEGNYIDCSAYVTWVLYEYGYKDLGPGQESTRTLLGLAQRKGWTVKDGSQAQAGDIVLIPRYHTAIYAGNGQFYDCGSTNLIRSPTTTWNPGYDYAITVTKP